MKNKFLLLAAALVLSTTTTFAATQWTSYDSGTTSSATSRDDMMMQVKVYMEDRGIMPTSIALIQGTENYVVKDTLGITYIVYTSNGVIYGHDQGDF